MGTAEPEAAINTNGTRNTNVRYRRTVYPLYGSNMWRHWLDQGEWTEMNLDF